MIGPQQLEHLGAQRLVAGAYAIDERRLLRRRQVDGGIEHRVDAVKPLSW